MRFLFTLLLLAALPAAAGTARHDLDGRSYHVATPAGWDGVSPLPVLIHFHGWGRTGAQVLRNQRIAAAASEAGVLLVAPDGLGKSWAFWSAEQRRDVDFTDAVLADLSARYPVARDRVFLSGFSYGGAMVWRIAMARGDAFAGYLPIAGALRGFALERPAGPARVWHVHGLEDGVMRPPVRRTDGIGAMEVWLEAQGLGPAPARAFTTGDHACRDWGDAEVRLCLHPGGHWIPRDWLAAMLPEMLGAERTAAN
ncbi:MAG: prolyl oligopeptidase family serine peptidase [Pseudomonadota bacterium]